MSDAQDRGAQIAALDPERQKLLARLLAERGGRSMSHRPTPAQERLHFLERLTPGRSLYWMPAAVRLVGSLDRAAVAAALAALVERHEALRTVFVEVDGRTMASVRPAAEMTAPLETVDLAGIADPPATLEVADRLASELASRPAALASGPVVRSLLARLGADDHLLVVVVHHIAADGWSLGLMVDELARDLAARSGHGDPPGPPPLQYRAYARWLEERLESPELARQLSAWTERLGRPAGDLPTLAPLADRPEAAARGGRSHRGESVPVAVAVETLDAVDRLAREQGGSPFAVLLAAWGATLGRLVGEDDVVVATPVANRPRADLARVVGLFVNTVVLRLAVAPAAPATALVERAKRVTTETLAGAEVPFERLVAALAPERRLGAHPLAQVMLALQDEPPPVPDLPGLAVHRRPVRSGVAKLDLTLDLERRDGGLVGELEIDRDLYDRATGERLAEAWSTVLAALVAAPETPVAELPLLSDAARRELLASGGEVRPEPDGDFEPLPAVWRRRAAEQPDAVAAVAGGESVTYGRLARRAGALAAVLAERTADVGPEPRVALLWAPGAPGIDLLTCLWAALDAGVAYVPLDPSLPVARRREILEQSGARLALGSRAALEALPDGVDVERLVLDEIPDRSPEASGSDRRQIHPVAAASAAYVLFTSGSTGRPKGVVVTHGALAVHARAVARAFRLTPDDRVLRTASPAFDVAVEEVFPTWSVGATVVGPAAGADPVVPGELSSLVDELGVTVANLPGSLWHEWVAAVASLGPDDPWPESLRLVVTGSEAVSPAAARRWWELGGPPLVNAYGLTEATVTSLLMPVDHLPPETAPRLPVGRPLPGVTAHVVDRRGRLLPDGAPGELRLGGGALARGYLGRPAETAAAFLPDPFSGQPGARQLATGDRAKRNGSGEIEILGRLDDQVKVRGFRIEPGEVESVLAAVAGVAEAAVVAAGAGAVRRLVGFWTPSAGAGAGEAPSEEALLAELGRRLPRPLVPARLVRLERLPTTASDKVDRRHLARRAEDLDGAAVVDGPGGQALTPIEELVAGVLGDLLERTGLGPAADFFELGGHSLLAGQAASRLGDALGVPVVVADLFERSTVAGLARLAEERRAGGDVPAREEILSTPADAGPHPLSPSQERFWLLERLAPGSPRYAIPAALDLDGSLDLAAMARALGSLVTRHEVLRSRFVLGESGPEQVVLDLDRPLTLPLVDVSGLPEDVRATETGRLSAVLAGRGFDLETPPHLAAALARRAPDHHRLVLSVHHIAADGWSFGLLVGELGALLAGRELPPPTLQFRDYARWQRRFLDGPGAEAQLEHWRGRLAPFTGGATGATGAFELDGDRPRPPLESFRGASETFRLDPQLGERLERLARRRGGTLFVGLAALVGSLLARWTGVGSGVLGTPVADRHAPETRGLVGPALNLLPVAVDASDDGPSLLSLDRLLERLAPRWLDDYAHRDVPFERLVDELAPDRDLSRSPLFQILLVLQNAPLGALDLRDVTATPVPVATGTARYDLAFSFDRSGDGLELTVERSTALYDAATVARLVRSFETFWRAAVSSPRRPLAELPLLAPAERHQVLREWQGGPINRRRSRRAATVTGQLAEQIHRTPDRPALTVPASGATGEVAWTYRQLGDRVAALARRLGGRGVGRGDLVAVALPRSAEMVVALLAVMDAGAATLPLDPDYPAPRLAQIVADARPVLALGPPGQAAPGDLPSLELSTDGLEPPEGGTLGTGPADGDDLAYVLYTSGSTGNPKGVAVTHGNATAFFAAMDPVLGVGEPFEKGGDDPPATFLATTSISFDISVLELFWSLVRGLHLVVHPGSGAAGLLGGAAATSSTTPPIDPRPAGPSLAPAGSADLALLYFADDASGTPGRERYRLLLDGARRGDELGFSAVWTPERHFHAFGGLYPNPSVVAAALAATTERIALRAGSVVMPLHQPVRVAEEWAVVDNLSDGRVGISFASGWHPRDFTLAPGSFEGRKDDMLEAIDQVRRLWRGESVELPDGRGEPVPIEIHPRPVQKELPVWLTAAGNPDTFRQAGEMGAGVLTHLLAQTEEELAEKIAVYRAASREAGHGDGSVTLMLHTFVGDDSADVRETVRGPLTSYLASSLDLVRGPAEEMGLDPEDLSDDDRRLLLDAAFERYYRGSGLFGTLREAARTLERMTALGVDEIGCLVDFGVGTDDALEGLGSLARLLPARSAPVRRTGDASERAGDISLPGLVERFRVTHLQVTPSLARLIVGDPASRRALGRLEHLVLGGEPLPVSLAEDLQAAAPGAAIHDLYGPTETTVWSSAHRLARPVEPVGPSRSVSVGRPVAGERVHPVDRWLRPVPPGVAGEVAIGGAGVARGYLGRPAATAAVFVPDPFATAATAAAGAGAGERLYLTGDLGRHRPDGRLELLGRRDQQVKVGGHRIELGEIEATLAAHAGVAEAVVVAGPDGGLHAFVVSAAEPAGGGEVARAVRVPALPRAVDAERADEILAGLERFHLPNGMEVAHLGDLHTRVGYEEIFENDSYFRHGLTVADGDTVLDVGANIGFFTLALHQRCRPGRVLAFEPIPATHRALAANVALYGLDAVETVHAGVGSERDTVAFTFYPGMDGLSGRYADPEADRAATRAIIVERMEAEGMALSDDDLEAFLDRQFESETHECPVLPLADVIAERRIERIDLLKVDVERAEVDVLRGLGDDGWAAVRQAVLEVDTGENLTVVEAMLREHGFDVQTDELVTVEGGAGRAEVEVWMVYASRDGLVREESPGPVNRQMRQAPREAQSAERPTRDALAVHLAERLPAAMVPGRIDWLERLPQTPNGKVDKKALAERARRPEVPGTPGGVSEGRRAPGSGAPPATEAERAVAEVWSRVLGVPRVGRDDNFFEVGGNSLLLARVHGALSDRFGREVPMLELFRKPTVASLAAFLSADQHESDVPAAPAAPAAGPADEPRDTDDHAAEKDLPKTVERQRRFMAERRRRRDRR